MSKKRSGYSYIGATKRSTDSIINGAILRQSSWMSRRREFANEFLKKLNIFARPAHGRAKALSNAAPVMSSKSAKEKKSGLMSYWFPILCAVIVIFIAAWAAFFHTAAPEKIVVIPAVPEPVVQEVLKSAAPAFDIVRIERDGNVVIAGRGMPQQNISVLVNEKIVATERTDSNGEFVYAPKRAFKPGNYTIGLVDADSSEVSKDKVFIYVSPQGYENSISLLMTKSGSTLLQSPKLVKGDLSVSKIDYLESGRIVVSGDGLPRLRVSLTLNGKYLGFARVSDHKHFGLGADVEKLVPGKEYSLAVRLHDGDGKTVAIVAHKFAMPEMTGDDDTFYTVRRGDCLWIIARNFLRKGILFSIIAERNSILNPDLIFPKQILQIPVKN
ncbi:MAG: LysM peptidoglycan-binding domain-containing protein [Rickettsiales bacterium]|jgi:nucleoid-associated protein YgaU|nr:LysM peptidoglycan-binding domain-containing protein [Rickettsiales bacterium]